MTKEELIQFLKDELKVRVGVHPQGFGGRAFKVKVTLSLQDRDFDTSEDWFDLPSCDT